MIVIEDHVVEMGGKKYVPYDIVIKVINENYISTVDNISTQLTNAMKEYNDGLKSIGLQDDQDSARSTN
tara:strand:- start:556 stop:762 length:207 start_codon:yes stop_codon:yes gene_type:complete